MEHSFYPSINSVMRSENKNNKNNSNNNNNINNNSSSSSGSSGSNNNIMSTKRVRLAQEDEPDP